MYQSDLKHSDPTLEEKLHKLYTLNRHKAIDLSFRPPFLNLLKAFGEPQKALPPVVHIAGTNGKGSTLAMMRAALEAMGKSVHVYTSPHLHKFNERIVLAGEQINDVSLEALIDEALALNDGAEVTFFEVTTAMAFAAFARDSKFPGADVCLLETGMGGRLDCTNVVEAPALNIITKISLDHTEHLGRTLEKVAAEKAGILKKNVPCIVGPQMDMDTVLPVIESRANEFQAKLLVYGRDWDVRIENEQINFTFGARCFEFPVPNLVGVHQIENAGTALAALYVLEGQFGFDVAAISRGLKGVHWAGRLERVEREGINCELWYDGGHNDSAGHALAEQMKLWAVEDYKELHLIVGMKADKQVDGFLAPMLPFVESITVVPIEGVGGCVRADMLGDGLKAFAAPSLDAALERHNDYKKRVLICGSLYLAAKLA